MDEYERLGHMAVAPASLLSPELPSFSLPHHAVLKPDNTSTKCRVVFDGSAQTTTVFTTDVGEMYRQVLIDVAQQQFQQILWRSAPSDDIKSYYLKTVTT
jgi:hypothetical protein